MKTSWIRKNGTFIPWDETKDHHLTNSLHYGGAVFEGIRLYDTPQGPKIFRLKEHIERLLYSAKVMHIMLPYTEEELMEATLELVKKNEITQGYIRPIIYLGEGNMSLNTTDMKPEVVISLWNRGKYLSDTGIRVKIPSIRRIHPQTTDMNAKISGNYANSILAGNEVHAAGYNEALLLDTQGNIAEGPGENIFFIKNGQLFTPTLGNILPGITRKSIITIAQQELGIQVQEITIPADSIGAYDEAFFVGTAAEVTPIASITNEQGTTFNYTSQDKEAITQKIKKIYQEIVHGENAAYKERLR